MKPPVGRSLVALGGLVFLIGIWTAIETLAITIRPWAWGSYWYAASFRWMTAGPMIFAGTVLFYSGVEHLRAGPMSNRRILINSAAQHLLVIGVFA